ncbi:MAG: TetR family transcriptional regulator C-terminal domain-containing protein [Elusimicrobia bacterium]|nr:TetR family transcriptional regulator C-terminal domain-containing protein [Elusimicrobiota bacterium]
MARPKDPKARQVILEQAEHLIHLRGYHGTSMDEIARCCGMTKANLFHHYGCKDDLVLAVFDAKMRDYQRRRVEPGCCPNDPIQAVGRIFKDAARLFGGNGCRAGCFVANMASEMSDVNESFRSRASVFFRDWTDRLARCFRKARSAGYFDGSLEPRSAAETVVSLYEGAVLLARAHRDASVLERVGQAAQRFLRQHQSRPARRR